MSVETATMSFGTLLELFFYNEQARVSGGACPHSLFQVRVSAPPCVYFRSSCAYRQERSHFFCLDGKVVRLSYERVQVNAIILPPPKLIFCPEHSDNVCFQR